MKKEDYSLLENPKGTTMYLLYADRCGCNLDIKEVEYLGFSTSKTNEIWPGDARCKETSYTQDWFDLVFKDRKTGEEMNVKVENNHWSGQRGFDTDEHLTCGKAPFPYMDIYFTTNKSTLIKHLENEGLLKTFKQHIQVANDTMNKIIEYTNEIETRSIGAKILKRQEVLNKGSMLFSKLSSDKIRELIDRCCMLP